MDLDRTTQQVAELVLVAAVPRGAGAVGHRDDHRVELRDHPPLGVHRGQPRLGVPLGEGADRQRLPHRAGRRREQLADLALGQGRVLAPLRRLLAAHRREGVRVGLGLRVGVLLALGLELGELGGQLGVQPLRSGEHVLEREVPQLGGGVLQREQVLDLVVEALPDHPAAVLVGRVQQRGDRPVALVEVGLPVQRVVLVGPRHVPHGGAGQGHRREAVGGGADAVLGVVPLDEQREAQPDLAEHRGRDQAHEPAVEVHVDAAVQPARAAQVAGGEVPVGPDRRG